MRTKQRYLELFVNAGRQFVTKVRSTNMISFTRQGKLAGYRRVRQGEPFWPSASYYRVDRCFAFRASDDGYIGHEIEVIDQRNVTYEGCPFLQRSSEIETSHRDRQRGYRDRSPIPRHALSRRKNYEGVRQAFAERTSTKLSRNGFGCVNAVAAGNEN